MLIKDIKRNGNEGIGKPEPLKENLTAFWIRRIDGIFIDTKGYDKKYIKRILW